MLKEVRKALISQIKRLRTDLRHLKAGLKKTVKKIKEIKEIKATDELDSLRWSLMSLEIWSGWYIGRIEQTKSKIKQIKQRLSNRRTK